MGIRIHKSIGWGTNKANEMVNRKRVSEIIDENDCDAKQFIKWLDKNEMDIIDFHHDEVNKYSKTSKQFRDQLIVGKHVLKERCRKRDYHWAPYENIVTACHDDKNRCMQIIPVGAYDWKRYDDSIDYIEAGGIANDKFKFIKNSQGIYPYIGMQPLTEQEEGYGLPKNLSYYNPYVPSDYSMLTGKWDKDQKPLASGEALKNLKENWRPTIPLDVTCLVWYIREGLKDPLKFTLSLRPSIFVYWG